MKRTRSRYVAKYKYNIYGPAKIGGDLVEINEFVCANNPNQAFLVLAKRLRSEERTVFLGYCDIVRIETLLPDKLDKIHKKKKREEQLPLFISYFISQYKAP